MSGAEQIAEAFATARADGRRAALMPYLMGGFPDLSTSAAIGVAYAEAGAHLVELGVPFSDPLADGPVIHAAGTAALASGARVEAVLEVGREIAERVPVVVMCYANPIFIRGAERFVGRLREAGISGLIVPDLPLEEADLIASAGPVIFLVIGLLVAAYWWLQPQPPKPAQLICMTIFGEYLGRVYMQGKHRPLYLVDEIAAYPPNDPTP